MSDAKRQAKVIEESIRIAAPIDKVWRSLTDEQIVPGWLGCMRYTKRVGAVFYMQQDGAKLAQDDISGATHCEILALDAPREFRFSWFVPGFPPTMVTFELNDQGTATMVRFRHDGWEQFPEAQIAEIFAALSGGWKSYVLPNLQRQVESQA